MSTFVTRAWVPVAVAVAVALGGVTVERLRGAFGSEAIFSATGSSAAPLEPTHLKRVTYEVLGPRTTSGSVSYLNSRSQPEQANFAELPWTLTVATTVPAVVASVVAQGNSDDLACRITVDGVTRDEQSSVGHHAQTSCLVKAA